LGGPEGCAAAAAWGAGEEFETCVGGGLEFVGHLFFCLCQCTLLLWGKVEGDILTSLCHKKLGEKI
jgi:hypothetical protein